MGGGSITPVDGTNNGYNNNVGITGGTFVNQQLLQGTGTIENLTGFTNSGTINDNVPVGSANLQLVISRLGSFSNTGTLEASNGGALVLALDSFTNTGGTISASGANSHVNTSGSTITGGTSTTSSGGTIYADQNGGTLSTLTGISNSGAIVIQDNNTAAFSGTVTNNGTITVDSTGDTTRLAIPVGQTLTLTGSGSVILTNFSQSSIDTPFAAARPWAAIERC